MGKLVSKSVSRNICNATVASTLSQFCDGGLASRLPASPICFLTHWLGLDPNPNPNLTKP